MQKMQNNTNLSARPPPLAVPGHQPIVCLKDGETRASLQRGERCRCPLVRSSRRPQSHKGGMGEAWGLPTHQCPAGDYLLRSYPAQHAVWLAQGRVLFHCSSSLGFGDYLRSIPPALVVAISMELALLLQCDIPTFDPLNPKRPVLHGQHVGRLFDGAHFAWDADPPPAAAVKTARITGYGMQRYDRAAGPTRLYSGPFDQVKRLLKTATNHTRSLFGPLATRQWLARASNLPLRGCLLRYLLRPSARLTAMVDEVLGVRTPRSGAQLAAAVAMHVRMGDAAFKNREWGERSTGAQRWKFGSELRWNTFAEHPSRALQCLMRASDLTGLHTPNGRAGRGSGDESGARLRDSAHGCLPCVFVSDSGWAERCARAVLMSPIIPPGKPIHSGASDTESVQSQANIDRIYLDWWLLARARVSVNVGQRSGVARSAFSEVPRLLNRLPSLLTAAPRASICPRSRRTDGK